MHPILPASDLITGPASGPSARAVVPRGAVGRDFRIREATADDLPWIDALQKVHSRELGFLPRMALVGKVDRHEVLVAEAMSNEERAMRQSPETPNASDALLSTRCSSLAAKPLGYLIASDRYWRRDEVGLVTQLCVVPEARRSLVAAALLQAQYDRSAYGCRLYSCWCAQDLAANRFWEAMGYVAIAFRSGARGKGRRRKNAECGTLNAECQSAGSSGSGHSSFSVPHSASSARIHLFWQKKIRGDDDPVSYWYPSQTGGGALRADRLVFPIPPGVHWGDVLPEVLPELEEGDGGTGRTHSDAGDPCPEPATRGGDGRHGSLAADVERPVPPSDKLVWPDGVEERDGFVWKGGKRQMTREMILKEQGVNVGGLWFIPHDAELVQAVPQPTVVKAKRPKAKPREKAIDPRVVAMARELRDRWFERPELVALPAAKHDVRRLAA